MNEDYSSSMTTKGGGGKRNDMTKQRTNRVVDEVAVMERRQGWSVWASKPSAAILRVSQVTGQDTADLVAKATGLTDRTEGVARYIVRPKTS